ncbi:MAG: zf-HC2 domain-containing protein [Planctomycetaceae bacterium]
MNCKLAEQNLALWVGGDLDETSVRELEEHLALCSECRAAGRRLKSAQRVLVKASHVETVRSVKSAPAAKSKSAGKIQIQSLRAQSKEGQDVSIWPNVARSLRALEARKRKQRFNGWIPAAAVIVACLAIILSPRTAVYNPSRGVPPLDTSAGMGNRSLFDGEGLIIGGDSLHRVGLERFDQFSHDGRPADSGKVNSSMGKFPPGLRHLFDERSPKK